MKLDINSNCDVFAGFDGDCDDDSDTNACKNQFTVYYPSGPETVVLDGPCIEVDLVGPNTCMCFYRTNDDYISNWGRSSRACCP